MLSTSEAEEAAFDLTLPNRATPPFSEAALRRRYARSIARFERAARMASLDSAPSECPLVDPFTTPMYFDRGQGARIWDVDGHEYVDFSMGFGALLFGHAHPEIEMARAEASACAEEVSPSRALYLELSDRLYSLSGLSLSGLFTSHAEAVHHALCIAQNHTGRVRLARASDRASERRLRDLSAQTQRLEFDANDPETLGSLLRAHPGEIAAVLLSPELVLPHDPSVFRELHALCSRHGALLIVDEAQTALRIAPGSVCARVGVVPDMLMLGDSLGNGFPMRALLASCELVTRVESTPPAATLHTEPEALARARCVLDLLARDAVQAHVARLGVRLIEGLNRAARELSAPAIAWGKPLSAMPFLRFNAPDVVRNQALTACFYREVLARGVLLHPRHTWFISAAHSEADIDRALSVAREALSIALTRHAHTD